MVLPWVPVTSAWPRGAGGCAAAPDQSVGLAARVPPHHDRRLGLQAAYRPESPGNCPRAQRPRLGNCSGPCFPTAGIAHRVAGAEGSGAVASSLRDVVARARGARQVNRNPGHPAPAASRCDPCGGRPSSRPAAAGVISPPATGTSRRRVSRQPPLPMGGATAGRPTADTPATRSRHGQGETPDPSGQVPRASALLGPALWPAAAAARRPRLERFCASRPNTTTPCRAGNRTAASTAE